MEALHLLQVSSVQGPCLTTIVEASENGRPVHLELCGLPDVVLVQDASLQAAKSLAGFADPGADLLVEIPVTADHTAEVFEVVNNLQPSAINWDGGLVGNCGRCWLKQDLCLAEADSETKEAGSREASADLLTMIWRSDSLCAMRAQSSAKSASRIVFFSLCLGCQSAKVEQGRQADIVGTLPVQVP